VVHEKLIWVEVMLLTSQQSSIKNHWERYKLQSEMWFDWLQFCRAVALEYTETRAKKLGGDRTQMTKFRKRKYNTSCHIWGQWVFRGTGWHNDNTRELQELCQGLYAGWVLPGTRLLDHIHAAQRRTESLQPESRLDVHIHGHGKKLLIGIWCRIPCCLKVLIQHLIPNPALFRAKTWY
jgi:hypothetical protein